jgi:hypothetical protein
MLITLTFENYYQTHYWVILFGVVITKAVNLMHLKTIKYACIYALKIDKICKKLLKFNFY